MTTDKYIYSCGCEASGDNVSSYCPLHNTPIKQYPSTGDKSKNFEELNIDIPSSMENLDQP